MYHAESMRVDNARGKAWVDDPRIEDVINYFVTSATLDDDQP